LPIAAVGPSAVFQFPSIGSAKAAPIISAEAAIAMLKLRNIRVLLFWICARSVRSIHPS
jgi:hypothetical protein